MTPKQAARIALRRYSLPRWAWQWREDVEAEAQCASLAGENPLLAARRFVRRQVLDRGLTGGHGEVRKQLEPMPTEEASATDVSVLSLARVLYARGTKRGKRGRRSAALKAFILAGRSEGLSFPVVAARYGITADNAKKHYRAAWSRLAGHLSDHAEELSADEHRLLVNIIARKRKEV